MNIYFSIDVETDGPIPGLNSMLSLGCVAFKETGEEVSNFTINLERLPEARQDPSTMKWWKENHDAYVAATWDPQDPQLAMHDFREWVKDICAEHEAKGIPVAYPAAFDYMFVYWYMMYFLGNSSPFSFSCIDMKTVAMTKLGLPYNKCTKRKFPQTWFKGCPKHDHLAVNDAREQGIMFMNMLNEQ